MEIKSWYYSRIRDIISKSDEWVEQLNKAPIILDQDEEEFPKQIFQRAGNTAPRWNHQVNKIGNNLYHHIYNSPSNKERFYHTLSTSDNPKKQPITIIEGIMAHHPELGQTLKAMSTATHPKFQGKGYGTKLKELVANHHGSLQSDGMISEPELKSWERLQGHPDFNFHDAPLEYSNAPEGSLKDEALYSSFAITRKSELEKGSLQSRNKYNPLKEKNADDHTDLAMWQDYTGSRNNIPSLQGTGRERALHKAPYILDQDKDFAREVFRDAGEAAPFLNHQVKKVGDNLYHHIFTDPNINDSTKFNNQDTDDMEHYDTHFIHTLSNSSNPKDEPISVLSATLAHHPNAPKAPKAMQVATHPKFQNKGYGTKLKELVAEHHGALISDNNLSPSEWRSWEKLQNNPKFNFYGDELNADPESSFAITRKSELKKLRKKQDNDFDGEPQWDINTIDELKNTLHSIGSNLKSHNDSVPHADHKEAQSWAFVDSDGTVDYPHVVSRGYFNTDKPDEEQHTVNPSLLSHPQFKETLNSHGFDNSKYWGERESQDKLDNEKRKEDYSNWRNDVIGLVQEHFPSSTDKWHHHWTDSSYLELPDYDGYEGIKVRVSDHNPSAGHIGAQNDFNLQMPHTGKEKWQITSHGDMDRLPTDIDDFENWLDKHPHSFKNSGKDWHKEQENVDDTSFGKSELKKNDDDWSHLKGVDSAENLSLAVQQLHPKAKQNLLNYIENHNQTLNNESGDTYYHGTPFHQEISNNGFQNVKGQRSGFLGSVKSVQNLGNYLSSEVDLAHHYGKDRSLATTGTPNNYKVLNVKVDKGNTLDLSDPKSKMPTELKKMAFKILSDYHGKKKTNLNRTDLIHLLDNKDFVNGLKNHGYDSVQFREQHGILKDADSKAHTLFVIDPSRLKVHKPIKTIGDLFNHFQSSKIGKAEQLANAILSRPDLLKNDPKAFFEHPTVKELLHNEIINMNQEVRNSQQGQRSGFQDKFGNNINTSSKSTFPSYYAQIGVKNKDHFEKVMNSKKGPIYQRMLNIAHDRLLNGYSNHHGYDTPHPKYIVEAVKHNIITPQEFHDRARAIDDAA